MAVTRSIFKGRLAEMTTDDQGNQTTVYKDPQGKSLGQDYYRAYTPPNVGQQLQVIQGNQAPYNSAQVTSNVQANPFMQQATDEIQPVINNQLQILQNSLNRKLTNLEGQKTGIEQRAADDIFNTQSNTKIKQNAYNNSSLARGIGRSTIASTGEASYGVEENRILANIDKAKTASLNSLEAEKSNLQGEYEDTKSGLLTDSEAKIRTRAEELKNIDYNRNLQERKFTADQEASKADRALKEKQFAKEIEDSAFDRSIKQQQLDIARINANKSGSGTTPKNGTIKIAGNDYNYPTTETGMTRLSRLDALVNDDKSTYVNDNGTARKLFPIEKLTILQDALNGLSVFKGGDYDMLKAAYQQAIQKVKSDMKNAEYETY
jgi:hypothetical protein